MSDAKVRFYTLNPREEAEPGKEACFRFTCPNGNQCGRLLIAGRTGLKHDPQNQNGGSAHWTWDGNREAPTFSPSINCSGCWHGYIRNGRCVSTSGQDEPEPAKAPGDAT